MKRTQISILCDNLAPVGLLMIAVATAYPLFFKPEMLQYGSDSLWYKYLYGAGALSILLCRLFSVHTDTDLRLRRLYRIENWSAIFFCVGTFFLFYPGAKPRDWLAFTLAGAAIQIFTSLMIPMRQRKISNKK